MIPFQKYQGTGNDFVMIDQRAQKYLTKSDTTLIERMCDRKFGIGADGLILLENHPETGFEMIYFNADGRESSMCGNGGRCITDFAHLLGVFENETQFIAIDGLHDAKMVGAHRVALKMMNVSQIEVGEDYFVLNTGSPHYIVFAEDISDINVPETGAAIRYSARFREEGINVNFVEKDTACIKVATYERGVEDETLSCGTGVTAAAIAYVIDNQLSGVQKVPIQTKGGELSVQLNYDPISKSVSDIWLIGSATKVFDGEFEIPTAL